MGPSGSGKSTLMHCMAGLDRPTFGRSVIGDLDIGTLDDTKLTQLRRDRMGFVFQSFNLVPTLTAAENITLPADLAGSKVDKDWFDYLVNKLGLAARLSHRPAELSGGQQQRVACARGARYRASWLYYPRLALKPASPGPRPLLAPMRGHGHVRTPTQGAPGPGGPGRLTTWRRSGLGSKPPGPARFGPRGGRPPLRRTVASVQRSSRARSSAQASSSAQSCRPSWRAMASASRYRA